MHFPQKALLDKILVQKDYPKILGHNIVQSLDSRTMKTICKFNKFSYCKYKDKCNKDHVKE